MELGYTLNWRKRIFNCIKQMARLFSQHNLIYDVFLNTRQFKIQWEAMRRKDAKHFLGKD
jgi:hypothetical protein